MKEYFKKNQSWQYLDFFLRLSAEKWHHQQKDLGEKQHVTQTKIVLTELHN